MTDVDRKDTDIASIGADGTLVPKKNGVVLVTATAADGGKITGQKQITITNQDLENIALNKSVSAGTQGSGNEADKAVDGDSSTRYGSAQHPSANWFQVNLGGEYEIHTVAIDFEAARAIDFEIQVSDDGSDWTTVTEVTNNENLNWRYTLNAPVKASYVKIDVDKTSNAEWGFSMYEFQVYGRKAVNVDLSKLQTAIADAKKIGAEEYTSASYQALQGVIVQAEGLCANPTDQDAVDAMVKTLAKAIKDLVTKADTSALETVIAEAEKVDSTKYTEESYGNLAKALADAKELLAKEDATQDEVDEMTETLQKAIDELEEIVVPEPVDTKALKEAITAAEEVDSTKYTEDSYGNLAKVLADAKELLKEEDATQSEVDAMAEALQKAIEDLKEIVVPEPVDTKALEEAITAAEEVDSTKYTKESYGNLAKVLADAKELLVKEDATQSEVDEMTETLQKAIDELEEISVTEPIDTKALEEAIETAKKIGAEGYTSVSYQALQDTIEQAEELCKNPTDQDAVNAMVETLAKAIKDLVKKADTSALKEAIAEAEEVDSTKYTEESYSVLKKALADAKELLVKEDATQSEVDAMAETLQKAIDELEEISVTEPIDTKALEEAIAGAKEIKAEGYTSASYQALQDVITQAEELCENPTDQKAVDAMVETLAKAIKDLVTKADTSALKEAIVKAEEVDSEKYTEESYSVLKEALADAKALIAKEDATQDEVNEMTETLQKAIEDLKEIVVPEPVNTKALEEAITAAEEVDSTKYTEESYSVLKKALADAKELLVKEDAAQSEVDEMTETLQKAIEDLKEIVVPKPVDTKALKETIETAKKIEAEGYTSASYQALQDVITQAEELCENPTDQKAVDAMVETLAKAIEDLVKKADTSALEEVIAEAEEVDSEKYTEESYSVLKEALADAKALITKEDATQSEVNAMAETLQKAIEGLKEIVVPKPVDTEALKEAIAAAEEVDSEKYTEESYENLAKVLANAKELLAKEDATQSEVNEMAETLQKAIDELEEISVTEPVNTKALEEAITAAEEVDSTKYTEESYSVLKKALADAKALIAKEDATQSEVDAMAETLQKAIDELEEISVTEPVNTKALEEAITAAEEVDSEKYTEESYGNLAKALADAKELLAKEDATQSEVDAMAETLQKAIDELEEISASEPGNDDQKPGDDNQKPGDDGQKPGDDGQKPGDDGQKPGSSTTSLSPKTDDVKGVAGFGILLGIAAVTAVGASVKRRRTHE